MENKTKLLVPACVGILIAGLFFLYASRKAKATYPNANIEIANTPEIDRRPTPNEAVVAYRSLNPSDTRSDDDITQFLEQKAPGVYHGYAGFKEDLKRLASPAAALTRKEEVRWDTECYNDAIEKVRHQTALVALGSFGVLCLILWIPKLCLWIQKLWHGTLKQTNQLSKAVQGKLDDPPGGKQKGEGT